MFYSLSSSDLNKFFLVRLEPFVLLCKGTGLSVLFALE